ncbi:hypothetical protein LJC68_06850 [Bacteroidales bacterium OttesenSCG-928-B11]|nr:hypothetical protein [Bacteroidales bacterium OttesenSCG-928-E04]MDL2308207.1 hypothetical protein [Bacteroidales bacterium OttesenSCG-928-C03]MDL2312579.1 hypothetical protein [Bacteroidales bacterium OttesenSCG-928-B11]MDL2325645.1 hypothetical protein [Bacteroidales bacterium OttesenSCG-928-A14]
MLRNRRITVLAWMLLGIFISYTYFTISFTHLHRVGQNFVVHIHPYDKANEAQHTHTLYDLESLNTLVFHFALLLFPLLLSMFWNTLISAVKSVVFIYKSIIFNFFHYRGPPVGVSCTPSI